MLLAAEGKADLDIAASLNISNQKAARWRKRFLQLDLAGLVKDAPRPGRKPAISSKVKEELIRRTTQSKPANATHWSTRTMSAGMGVSEATVRRVWHAHGLKPHLVVSMAAKKGAKMAGRKAPLVWLRYGLRQRAYQPNSMAVRLGDSARLPYGNFGCPAATGRLAVTSVEVIVWNAITRS